MLVLPGTAIDIVKSCCVLHNFVRRRDGYVFEDSLTCDMDDVEQVAAVGGRSTGIAVRDSFWHTLAALALSHGLIRKYKCETTAIVL
jgi:hypothetical protein